MNNKNSADLMNKKILSERDICTKFITPSLVNAGWNVDSQIREEFSFTAGRIYDCSTSTTRRTTKNSNKTKHANAVLRSIGAKHKYNERAQGFTFAGGFKRGEEIKKFVIENALM